MRILKLGLVLILLAALSPASAGARGPREREVEAPYKTPVLGIAAEGNRAYYFDCLNGIGCARLPLEKGDRFATLRIEDAVGLPVHGDIYLMPGNVSLGEMCGETEAPISVSYASEILVHVHNGTCAGPSPSIATMGKVVATISKRR